MGVTILLGVALLGSTRVWGWLRAAGARLNQLPLGALLVVAAAALVYLAVFVLVMARWQAIVGFAP